MIQCDPSYRMTIKEDKKEKKKMTQPVYAIRDMLVEFHAPMVGVNDEQMIRDFLVFCNTKSEIEKKDLQLYRIGEYDTKTGIIIPCEPEYIKGGFE